MRETPKPMQCHPKRGEGSEHYSLLPTPYSLRVLIFLGSLMLVAPACAQDIARSQCVVSRVVDGDTIDSPELDQGLIATAARAALAEVIPDSASVWLERDVAPIDRYGRTLAYVWAGEILVNEHMLERGWAVKGALGIGRIRLCTAGTSTRGMLRSSV
jgi:hypothetical protein